MCVNTYINMDINKIVINNEKHNFFFAFNAFDKIITYISCLFQTLLCVKWQQTIVLFFSEVDIKHTKKILLHKLIKKNIHSLLSFNCAS